MRKLFALLLSLAAVLTLSCCGSDAVNVSLVEPVVIADVPDAPEELPEPVLQEQSTESVEQLPEVTPECDEADEIASVTEETQQTAATDAKPVCTLSITCKAAIGKLGDKADIIPADGIIFPEQKVTFSEGDSVFDVLVRELKNNNIHIEYENAPIYGSVYIEGIANLYEFDCGGGSGWVYLVNGQSPGYGCSQYKLSAGDKIEWIYVTEE